MKKKNTNNEIMGTITKAEYEKLKARSQRLRSYESMGHIKKEY